MRTFEQGEKKVIFYCLINNTISFPGRKIPGKCGSSARVNDVPTLCIYSLNDSSLSDDLNDNTEGGEKQITPRAWWKRNDDTEGMKIIKSSRLTTTSTYIKPNRIMIVNEINLWNLIKLLSYHYEGLTIAESKLVSLQVKIYQGATP